METVALLDMVLYRFRDLFGSQNFSLFCAYLYGVILCEGRHSVTQIYLASGYEVSYWSCAQVSPPVANGTGTRCVVA